MTVPWHEHGRTCAATGVCGIAIEAGKTLLLEPAAVAQLCERHKIGIHTVD